MHPYHDRSPGRAQAGVSTGRIQHWLVQQRWDEQSSPDGEPTPREALRWVLLETVPRDDRRRREWLVGVAYLIRMLANPHLRARYAEGLPRLHQLLAGLVRTARDAGGIAPDRDPETEAAAAIDYYLDRLFTR